jgi:hypothetical protein
VEGRAYAPQATQILRRGLISSRGGPYDSPGTLWFREEIHVLVYPNFAQFAA